MVETGLFDSSAAFIGAALLLLTAGQALPAMKEILADPWLAPASDPDRGAGAARFAIAASAAGVAALAIGLLWEGLERLLPLLR